MPLARPSLTDLFARAQGDIDARVPGADSRVRRSMLRALAAAHAGAAHGLYGYLEQLGLQIFPDTAEGEFLERLASIWSVARKPSTFARLTVRFTGEEGAPIPLGALLQRARSEYQTIAVGVISGGQALVEVEAAEPGSAGTGAVADTIALISPLAGVKTSATVHAIVVAGVDEETDALLRARLRLRISLPPQGGAAEDWVTWALQVPGVTRAWVRPNQWGAGTVGVLFVVDDDPGGFLPSPEKVAEMQAYLTDPARKPVTALVVAAAPVAKVWDFTIGLEPDTPEIRAAIEAELADLLLREGAPGGVIPLTHVAEAISTAPGEFDHDLVVPSGNLTHANAELPVLGTITWV